jgi:RHS repeat-associated protein
VRHLFTGQQWYKDVGLYDLRNRFYSPDIGRFLQPDPIGFWGGNNLYGYCRNNPVRRRDPLGLLDFRIDATGGGQPTEVERVTVIAPDIPEPIDPGGTGPPSGGGGGGPGGEPGIGPGGRGDRGRRGGRGVLHVDYGAGNPAYVGSGTEEDPSNWNTTGDPGVYVNWHTGPASNQTVPGAAFYGTNPGGTSSPYLFVVNPGKIIIPVTRQFTSYNLVGLGNAVYYGTSAYAIAGLLGIGAFEAATTGAFEPFRIDGPSTGFIQYGQGSIIGLRYGDTPLVRLDYHPLSSGGQPVLHLNVGPQGTHVPLWPWWY